MGPGPSATAHLQVCFDVSLCKKETNKRGQICLMGRLRSLLPLKSQQVSVLSACVPTPIHGTLWALSFQPPGRPRSPGCRLELGDLWRGWWAATQRPPSTVQCLFLFIRPLTFYGILRVRPELECQPAHNASIGKSLFCCVSSS